MALAIRANLAAVMCLLAMTLVLPRVAEAAGNCSAPAGWFSGVPDVPTATPESPCQFQQWAWQTFLALLGTSPAQPVPRYLTWDFPKPDINALFCQQACGGTPSAAFNLCGGPSSQEVVNATTQPGFPPKDAKGNVLSGEVIDQAGNPIYFTAHVSPQWVSFVSGHGLGAPAALAGADSRLAFPSGSFEIKTSWRLADELSQAERAQYFVTHACVEPETANCPGGKRGCHFEADLALVGFHITGGADNHPELVWATFEHQLTAPDCDETPQPGPWSLYDGVTDCRTESSRCNQPNTMTVATAANPAPINVCHKYSHGGAAPDVAQQIDHLNRSVQANLPRQSPLRFYQLVGTLWSADPQPTVTASTGSHPIPTLNLTSPAGSPLLSNSSLETFKQDISCFGCHNSQFPGEFSGLVAGWNGSTPAPATLSDKNLYVSHVVLFPYFFDKALNCSCP
jgi:hypothetical protein